MCQSEARMTEPTQSSTYQTVQIQPRVVGERAQPTLFANTFIAAAVQGNVHIDFALLPPTELQQIGRRAQQEEQLIVEVPPIVRLAIPLEAAQQLVDALTSQIANQMVVRTEGFTESREDKGS